MAFTAFGLTVESSLPCPELAAGDGPVDVRVRFGPAPICLTGAEARGERFQADRDRFLLFREGVARYLVSGGGEIVIDRAPHARDEEIRLFLLGPVFGALLHQRGVLPLHGSAIEIDGEGVAFLGRSGSGKSTLAGALWRRGYPLVSDDVCAVVAMPAGPRLLPGIPRLKLWMDAAVQLGEDIVALPRVRPNLAKLELLCRSNHSRSPLPLRRIYVLSTSSTTHTEIEPLRGADRLAALVDHTYRLRFRVGDRQGHFRLCAAVARHASFRRLRHARALPHLQPLVDQLETDLFQ